MKGQKRFVTEVRTYWFVERALNTGKGWESDFSGIRETLDTQFMMYILNGVKRCLSDLILSELPDCIVIRAIETMLTLVLSPAPTPPNRHWRENVCGWTGLRYRLV